MNMNIRPGAAAVGEALAAVVLWLGLGFSLGWHYTFTYYGRTGIPVPFPEGVLSIILYYFSVVNTAIWIEAVHWLLVFPLAGVLWVCILVVSAASLGGIRVPFLRTLFKMSCASIPLCLPAPFMMYMAGVAGQDNFTFGRAIDVALRKGNILPPDWLTPLYLGLGLVSLAVQVWIYRRSFGMRGARAWRHYLLSLVAAVCMACVTGAVISMPLRLLLE
jgi:hypothetical protein